MRNGNIHNAKWKRHSIAVHKRIVHHQKTEWKHHIDRMDRETSQDWKLNTNYVLGKTKTIKTLVTIGVSY